MRLPFGFVAVVQTITFGISRDTSCYDRQGKACVAVEDNSVLDRTTYRKLRY